MSHWIGSQAFKKCRSHYWLVTSINQRVLPPASSLVCGVRQKFMYGDIKTKYDRIPRLADRKDTQLAFVGSVLLVAFLCLISLIAY
jgi:hypothetical protein